MPIRAEMKHRYPKEWPLISLWVRVCAGWRCEWCAAVHGQPNPKTGSKVVLTVAHVHDPAPENVTPGNLAALCQRCHNRHDGRSRANGTRLRAMATLDLLDAAPVARLGGFVASGGTHPATKP
jgi:hypothetical protein